MADTSSNVVTGQALIAVTGTAVRLTPSNILVNGLIVRSLVTNNSTGQTVGGSGVTNVVNGTGNGYILQPGEAAAFGVTNVATLFVNGTAGDIFTWEGN